MFVAGTSTQKVGEVAHTLMRVALSASTISRASTRHWPSNLKRGVSARGHEHWRILYLDGVHLSIRHGDKADSTLILTALGVDLEGCQSQIQQALSRGSKKSERGRRADLHVLRVP
jgi:putative transposase